MRAPQLRIRFTDSGKLLVRDHRGFWVLPREGMRHARERGMSRSHRVAARAALMGGRPFVECHYCGVRIEQQQATLDHVIPRSKGGGDGLSNLLLACAACNSARGSTPYAEFVARCAA